MAWVAAVAAIVRRQGRVLAMRRALTKDTSPGAWETISGRVEEGEQPIDAALREIREEAGIEVLIDPRPIGAVTSRRGAHPMLIVYYAADWVEGEVRASEEHDDFAWCTIDELDARCDFKRLVAAARLALERG